ncbi:MAG: M23 family metallopeptidase [Micromonosporaceae bacterium]
MLGLLVSGAAWGDAHDDKSRIDKELARAKSTLEAATKRARAAGAAYTDANQKLPEAKEQLAVATGEQAAAEVRAKRAARNAARAGRVFSTATKAYRAAERRVAAARERAGAYSAAAYKGQGAVVLGSLLDAKTPTDLAQRMAYVNRVAKGHQNALRRVSKLRHESKLKQNSAELAKRKAVRVQRRAEEALVTARNARRAAAGAAGEVRELIASRKEGLRAARGERHASLERYRELEAESERIASQIRGLAKRDAARKAAATSRDGARERDGTRTGGGYFMMPVQGYKSSDFGRRFDPYYQVWQLHAGVDLAAAGGTPVRAAAAGTVFRAGYYGGYGNYTCVYHGVETGEGLATCYAHQSSLAVSAGERVGRGEVIGRVGSTGASTGDHLHFEVRLDGDPVNPLGWLPSCLC